MIARRLAAFACAGLASACSILGSVEGDYTLGAGGAGGATEKPRQRTHLFSSQTDVHITKVLSHNSMLYGVGWFIGDTLQINESEPVNGDSTDGLPDAFVFRIGVTGQVDALRVFGRDGSDKLHSIDMLSNGDIIVVGEACNLGSFTGGDGGCGDDRPRAAVVHLAGSDFATIDAKEYGAEPSYAKDVHISNTDEIVVAARIKTGQPDTLVPGCTVSEENGSGGAWAYATLHATAPTLDCTAELFHWSGTDLVQGLAANAGRNRRYIVGTHGAATALELPQDDHQAGFLVALEPGPQWAKSWDGGGLDVMHDVMIAADDDIVSVGGLTDGGQVADETAPSSRAAMVTRHDPSGSRIWGILLSSNVGSDAEATAVVEYGTVIIVAGTFRGDMRIFGENGRLDAVGKQDMFLASLGPDGMGVTAVGYGGPNGTATPTSLAIIESSVLVAGHIDASIELPDDTLSCPSGADGCSFMSRLPQP